MSSPSVDFILKKGTPNIVILRAGDKDITKLEIEGEDFSAWQKTISEWKYGSNATLLDTMIQSLDRVDLDALNTTEQVYLFNLLVALVVFVDEQCQQDCFSIFEKVIATIFRSPTASAEFWSYYNREPEFAFYAILVRGESTHRFYDTSTPLRNPILPQALVWSRQVVDNSAAKGASITLAKHILILALLSPFPKERNLYLQWLLKRVDLDNEEMMASLQQMLNYFDERQPDAKAGINFNWLVFRYHLRRYELRRTVEKPLLDEGHLGRWFKRVILGAEELLIAVGAYSATIVGVLKHFAATRQWGLALIWLISLPILLLIVMAIAVIYKVVRGADHIPMDILFPKLIGAVLVGLSVMAITPESWWLPFNLPFVNLALIALLALALSYFFLFAKIHRVYIANSATLTSDGRELRKRTAWTAWKVFLIGLIIALTMTFMVSGLLYPMLYRLDGPGESGKFLSDLLTRGEGTVIFYHGLVTVSIGFFPRLLLLWTSMGLFIGTFVQLLWEENIFTE